MERKAKLKPKIQRVPTVKSASNNQLKLNRCEKFNIPAFIFTAEDGFAVEMLRHYLHTCTLMHYSEEYLDYVRQKIKEFEDCEYKVIFHR
jgi:hypothetical protein